MSGVSELLIVDSHHVTVAVLAVSIRHCQLNFSCYFPQSQHCSIVKSGILPLSHICVYHKFLDKHETYNLTTVDKVPI